MIDVPEVETSLLRLRGWRDNDRAPFAALNADDRVARWLAGPLTRAESDGLVDRVCRHWDEHGFGLWAAEVIATGELAGWVGLAVPRFEATFTPTVEVGWRLAPSLWGRGYATEGGRAALAFAVDPLGLDEVVSFTAVGNDRSRAVMERLGMTRDPADDFDHPLLGPDHPLRRHVLYRWRPARRTPDRSG